MMGLNVYVTRELPRPALDFLAERVERMDVNPDDRVLDKAELIEIICGRDGVLCTLNNEIDAQVMDAAPTVKIYANYAVGYNNIDVKAATERGIFVTNTPGVLTDTTADLAWALIMSVARRVVEGDRFMRGGRYEGWAPMLMLGADVSGKTLGIVGAGRIGTAVGLRSKGFNMHVLYTDAHHRSDILEKEVQAKRVDLDTLLASADFVSLHVPLTEETYHLVSRRELGLMKQSAFLINTSRGPVVDEVALVEALKNREIAGAGLDVYEDEPAMKPGLAELDNTVLLPHLGSATVETRTKMAMMAAENLVAALEGRKPPNLVNQETWTRASG